MKSLFLASLFACFSATVSAQIPSSMPDTTATLQAELEAYRARFTERATQETIDAYDEGVEIVGQDSVLQSALQVGQNAPDFTLPAANGDSVRLSDLLAQGPVILTWYRGGWCPYCNLQLRAYQAYLPQFKALGANLIAISPEQPDKSLSTQEKNALDFYVLSDNDNTVARTYGVVYTVPEIVLKQFEGKIDLAEYAGNDKNELPLGVTYVIAQDGTVAYAYINKDYRKRAEPAAILKALEGLK